MDLSPTDEQAHLRDSLSRFLAKSASPERVREAEPLGFDRDVWDGLVGIGAVAMGLPATHGGAGAALADLAVVAERAGSAIAPAPIVEAMVAARLLASCVGPDDAWLGRVAEGTALVTLAVRPAASGTATLVPGAAVADAALALDADPVSSCSWPLRAGGASVENLASAPLADVATDGGRPRRARLRAGRGRRVRPGRSTSGARSPPAGSAGSHARRSASACEYAKDRKQFGVPIGSFQAVQHQLADVATSLDGAELLAAKAVWALDDDEAVADRFASMAFWFAAETAERGRVRSAALPRRLRLHGGVRHPALLPARQGRPAAARRSPRRAAARWPTGCSPTAPRVTTELEARPWPSCPGHERRGPDFRLGPEVEAFRDEVRAFLAEHVTDEVIEQAHRTGTVHDRDLHRPMASQGWISAGWPDRVRRQGRSPLEMNALTEEMYLSGAPVDGLGIAAIVAHTLLHRGHRLAEGRRSSPDPVRRGHRLPRLHRARRRLRRGGVRHQGRARRRRVGRSTARRCSPRSPTRRGYVFLLTRTNTEVAKHKGLTMFLVPLDTPGHRASHRCTPWAASAPTSPTTTTCGSPTRYRVGDVDGGWSVMMTALVVRAERLVVRRGRAPARPRRALGRGVHRTRRPPA